MKKSWSSLMSAAIVAAAFGSGATARAVNYDELRLTEVVVENANGEAIDDGEVFEVSSETSELSFRATFRWVKGTSLTAFKAFDPDYDVPQIDQSCVFDFRMYKYGTTAAADKSYYEAKYSGSEVNEDGDLVVWFTYTPTPNDFAHAPYIASTGGRAIVRKEGAILGGTDFAVLVDGTDPVYLKTAYAQQYTNGAVLDAFKTHAAGVAVNMYGVKVDDNVATGITVPAGETVQFSVYRDTSGNSATIPVSSVVSDTTKASVAAAVAGATSINADTPVVAFTVTGIAIGETEIVVSANGVAALTIPLTVTKALDAPDEDGIAFSPSNDITLGEKGIQLVTLEIGSARPTATTFSVVNTLDGSTLTYPSTVTVDADRTRASFSVVAAEGLSAIEQNVLVFTDDAGFFKTDTLYVTVTNTVLDPSNYLVTFPSDAGGVALNEGDTKTIQVHLGSPVRTAGGTVFTVASSSSDIQIVASSGTGTTVTVPVDQNGTDFYFTVNAIDGRATPQTHTITVSDNNGFYTTVSLPVTVTNVDPSFTTPVGGQGERNGLQNYDINFPVNVKDPGVADSVTLLWDFGDGSAKVTGSATDSKSHRYSETGTYTVYVEATDKDGATATASYEVTVEASVTVVFTSEITDATIKALGGAEEGTTFTIVEPATETWNADGNLFAPKRGIRVRPNVPSGSYPVGWYVSSADDGLVEDDTIHIVNPSTSTIAVTAPEEGAATIRHFSSKPYQPYALNGYVEGFGDFDQDGLSDTWESTYLTNEVAQVGTAETFWQLSVARPNGDYGSTGNPDADYMPTSAMTTQENRYVKYATDFTVEVTVDDESGETTGTNVTVNAWSAWQPYYGWVSTNVLGKFEELWTIGDITPEAWRDNLVKVVTNTVSAHQYPLVISNGRRSYSDSSEEEENGGYKKAPFTNLDEYRGLSHALGGDPSAATEAGAPAEWAAFDVQFRYAPELVKALDRDDILSSGNRGDTANTDPRLDDTDEDGMKDGWEYYFWSTVYHEINSANWRAYDPSFKLYTRPTATSGIPLLQRNGGEPVTILQDPAKCEVIAGVPIWEGTFEIEDPISGAKSTLAPITRLYGKLVNDNGQEATITLEPFKLDPAGRTVVWARGYDGYKEYCIQIGTIDMSSGKYSLSLVDDLADLFGSGWEIVVNDEGEEEVEMHMELTLQGVQDDGLFPKEYLLQLFDPWRPADSALDMSSFVAADPWNLDPEKWVAAEDVDNDGLLNVEEYYLGTNPLHWDTDGDGMPDGWEVMRGLLPLDPRSSVNDCGPDDNPDGDMMYASGGYKHAQALLYDYFNYVWWDGDYPNEFVPNAATLKNIDTGDGEWDALVNQGGLSNIEEFLVAHYILTAGPLGGGLPSGAIDLDTELVGTAVLPAIYPSDWATTTTDPFDSDTNHNFLPDGWELYVGTDPIAGKTGQLSRHVVLVWDLYYEMHAPFPYPGTVGDPDKDGLDWWQEYGHFVEPDSALASDQEVPVDGGRTNAVRRAVLVDNKAWTNKGKTTNPWNVDTDNDGLDDRLEFTDRDTLVNSNGDQGDDRYVVNFDPTSVDTDRDGLPDAFEYLTGMYDATNAVWAALDDPFGPYGDPDGDGLANFQEYMTAAVYGWRYDKWYSPDNKDYWVPDGRMGEDDLASVENNWRAYGYTSDPGFDVEKDAYPYGRSVHFRHYQAADFLNPAPSPLFVANGKKLVTNIEKRWGLPGPDPEKANEDDSELAQWEQRIVEIKKDERYAFTNNVWISKGEWTTIMNLAGVISSEPFCYGRMACEWDSRLGTSAGPMWFGDPLDETIYTYIPPNFIGTAGFPGTYTRNPDTDNDGMDDYWEIFHGMDPLYGAGAVIAGAGGDPDNYTMVDERGVRHWPAAEDPARVRVLTPTVGFLGGVPSPWSREETGIYIETLFGREYYAESRPYDLYRRPYLAGDPQGDPDQDGLTSYEEAVNELAPDVLHHTDPTPYWITDPFDPLSYVNLYYGASSILWVWDWPGLSSEWDPPQYLFDFETNEGYDTDNDNISDRAELTTPSGGAASSADMSGGTDPLDFDSPVRRKALYLDGYAAARTRNPFAHDKWSLASYTAEFWFRAENPVAGHTQVLLDRPVWMPVDVSGSGPNPGWAIRHTFLVELDGQGWLTARVDNDGIERTTEPVVLRGKQVVPDRWYHVAVVLDTDNDRFSLYIDGEIAQSVTCRLKPCTGIISGSHYREIGVDVFTSDAIDYYNATHVENGITNVHTFAYSPAPIVVGAADLNPWGIVNGPVDMNPWGIRSLAGYYQPEFDPDQFFQGWVDEVRVWDRARTQAQIVETMNKRFTREDVLAVNEARRKWDFFNLDTADSLSDFPQKILYHYSFDNLPDPVENSEREDEAPSYDTSETPFGWPSIARIRATPYIPWWNAAGSASTVYASDRSYIPVIENTAAHLPQYAPLDLKAYKPVFDYTTAELKGYVRRSSDDWVLDHVSNRDFSWMTILSNGTVDVKISQIANSMNPYGMAYYTGINYGDSVSPTAFGGYLDKYGLYKYVPISSDMLPLLGAMGDLDVPMWDGKGFGWDRSAVDTDGDGLPDWWETANGLDPYSKDSANGAYGDPDGDGLDNWAEYLAGTDPNAYDTDRDGYPDYYSRPDGESLTYGQLYDDGDAMPNLWEIENGLDPNRYDADSDLDEDGWTNWEEYMAGTNPDDANSFPTPELYVKFHYSGEQNTNATFTVESYSEKRTSLSPSVTAATVTATGSDHVNGSVTWVNTVARGTIHEMGGESDARYVAPTSFHRFSGLLNPEYTAVLNGTRFNVVHLGISHIDSDSAKDNLVLELIANDPSKYAGKFSFAEGTGLSTVLGTIAGTAWPATLSESSIQVGSFEPVIYLVDPESGELATDFDGNKIADFGFFLEYETGAFYFGEAYKGLMYLTDAVTVPAFTISGYAFPWTQTVFERANVDINTHMRSGPNRFWGYIDIDQNGRYDVGEPAGLGTERPTAVSWNPVEVEIPLKEEVFGFPRIDLSATTEGGSSDDGENGGSAGATNVSDYVTVVFYRNTEAQSIGEVLVRKPRHFVQEHDYLVNSRRYVSGGGDAQCFQNGVPFGNTTTMTLRWEAYDSDTQSPFKTGTVEYDLGIETRNTSYAYRPGRREMVPVYPTQSTVVHNTPVELQWRMDWRTMGVFVKIERKDGASWTVVQDSIYVPFPVQHGSVLDDDYYYTCRPQLELGDGSFLELPSGEYRFTVTENLNSTSAAATRARQSVVMLCQLQFNEEDSGFELEPEAKNHARDNYSVSGVVKYFGKVMDETVLQSGIPATENTDIALDSSLELEDLAGTISVELVNGGNVVDSMSDIDGVGVRGDTVGTLVGSGMENGGYFASGTIDYANKTVYVMFEEEPPAGSTMQLVTKKFPVPLVIQAYKVNAEAVSGAGVSGVPVAQVVQTTKGPYSVPALNAGSYVIRAFLDSNGNGVADTFETQGFGLDGYTVSPEISPSAPPVVVSNDLVGVTIVLHDRDTDNDLLPDSWEYLKYQSAVAGSSALKTMYTAAPQSVKDRMVLQWRSGYDASDAAGLKIWEEYADGMLDSDPRTPDTDGDGLTDAMELLVTHTDTHRKDTDGDGVGDLEEFLAGSDPLDPEVALRYSMPALEFDAETGAPYVDCPYPALRAGTVLEYILQRTPELGGEWEEVFAASVAATDAAALVPVPGSSLYEMPGGVMRMVPADAADTVDWKSGFFRVRVVADIGKVVDNGDGTFSWWTWTRDSDGSAWYWREAARGTGVLERNASGEWSFLPAATGDSGSLVRNADGSWSLAD